MARNAGTITVPISEVLEASTINITLTGVKVWTARMAIALIVLRIAAWISPLPFVIDHGKTDLQG